MNFFKKAILVIALVSVSSMAQAFDLKSARQSGKVKELSTGYLEAVDQELTAKVKEINAKRKKHYEKIAKKNGIDVGVVAGQAAKKLMKK